MHRLRVPTILGALAILTVACSTTEHGRAVSECGGFGAELPFSGMQEPAAGGTETPGYCDSEVLIWKHDEAAGTLTLHHRRHPLNCCGQRDITLEVREDGRYVVDETDAPKGLVGTRCRCMCAYDFALRAERVPRRPIALELRVDSTDDDAPARTLFAGTLDLAAGSGRVVLDANPLVGSCP